MEHKEMKQEDKELLLKDLCARLPYGVKGNYQNSDDELLKKVTIIYGYLKPNGMVMTGDIKPYLFPLSSMTEEQKKEMKSFDPFKTDEVKTLGDWAVRLVEFYNKHHFDYHGLIPKGLAIDATGLNIY